MVKSGLCSGLEEVSRLKGIEAVLQSAAISVSQVCLEEVSRLKGIETYINDLIGANPSGLEEVSRLKGIETF